MVSHHFDEGIPYEEAYKNLPWPQQLQNDVAYPKMKTTGKKIFLSLAALKLTRHEKADYWPRISIFPLSRLINIETLNGKKII